MSEILRALQKTKPRWKGHPRRWVYEHRPLKGRKGMTKRKYYLPVEFGDPKYDTAPLEEMIIRFR